MVKNRLLLLLAAASVALSSGAKPLKDLWVDMPDSLLPYLNKSMRTELVDLFAMQVKANVTNQLGGECVMDTLTHDFVQVSLSEASVLQMKMVPQMSGDSILCVVKTLRAPEPESEVMLYNQHWQPLDMSHAFDGCSLQELQQQLMAKPDTMTESHYQELKAYVEPKMLHAQLSPNDNTLTLGLSLPLVANEDKKRISSILLQMKVKRIGNNVK